jgi:transposase-like protein
MADELRIGLSKLLRKAMIEQDASFLQEGVRLLSQALMEMEVEEHVGASRHERSPALARGSATDTARGTGTRGSGPWN